MGEVKAKVLIDYFSDHLNVTNARKGSDVVTTSEITSK